MTARQALDSLNRRLRSGPTLHDRLAGFGPVVGFPDGELVQPPRGYAIDDDEQLPRAAQPMFTLAEKVLLGSLAALGTALIALGVSCIGG